MTRILATTLGLLASVVCVLVYTAWVRGRWPIAIALAFTAGWWLAS